MQKIVQILVVFVLSVSSEQEGKLSNNRTCKSQSATVSSFFDQIKAHFEGLINKVHKNEKDYILQDSDVSCNA